MFDAGSALKVSRRTNTSWSRAPRFPWMYDHDVRYGKLASNSEKYVPWFRAAQEVLGDSVTRVRDEDVSKWVSKLDWAILPYGNEESAEEAKNRPFPNIWLRLEDRQMTIGLVCNTVRSIERMKNILTGFHTPEKQDFLNHMRKLDDTFQTSVSTKIKEFNPRQSPDYQSGMSVKSNRISAKDFLDIFSSAETIRERGLVRRREEGKSWAPESPSLTLARTTFQVGSE